MNDIALFCDVSLNPILKLGVGAYLVVPAALLESEPHSIEVSQITDRLVMRRFEGTSSAMLEVQTVLWSLEEYFNGLKDSKSGKMRVYSDSQCVVSLLKRRPALEAKDFISRRTNRQLKNTLLYRRFYEYHDELGFEIIKVTGHSRSCSHDTVTRIFSLVDRNVRKVLNLWICEFGRRKRSVHL
jgi:ribonuclease HI